VIASLALCLGIFINAGDISAGLVASASPAIGTLAHPAAPQGCLPLDDAADHAYTQAELAHSYSIGVRERGDDIFKPCLLPRAIPTPATAAPTQPGQIILVSRGQQWLWAYQDGHLVFATPVTTGQPDLPTPLGVYRVTLKRANTTFYSPWPKGSPYYYAPLHINYALLFRAGGFYIHDAPWRSAFGPGTNFQRQLPDGTSETGSHGCVNVPTSAGAWLYHWAHIGAQIVIVDSGASHQAVPAEHLAA
jgi:lipoprotein-anchoring transpeptidase ErfK/SrfK